VVAGILVWTGGLSWWISSWAAGAAHYWVHSWSVDVTRSGRSVAGYTQSSCSRRGCRSLFGRTFPRRLRNARAQPVSCGRLAVGEACTQSSACSIGRSRSVFSGVHPGGARMDAQAFTVSLT
jgi:hypothetical protein